MPDSTVRIGMTEARVQPVPSAKAAASPLMVALAFATIYTVWGSTYLAIRIAIEAFPPLLMGGLRHVAAAPIVLMLARLNGQPLGLRVRDLRALALIGVLLVAGGSGGVTWAEQYVPTGLAALLIATVPLWMAGLEALLPGGERLSRAGIAGIALGFAGIFVLLGPKLPGGHRAILWPEVVVLGAALSWSSGSILSKKVSLRVPSLVATGWQMLLGGIALAGLGLLAGEARSISWSGRSLTAFIYLTLVGTCLGFTAYTWLLRHVAAAKVATYAYVNPGVAVLLGWAVLGEPLTPAVLTGMVIIAASVILVTATRGPTRP